MIVFMINQNWGAERLNAQLSTTPTYRINVPEKEKAHGRKSNKRHLHIHVIKSR